MYFAGSRRYRILYVDIAGAWYETEFNVHRENFESRLAHARVKEEIQGGCENDRKSWQVSRAWNVVGTKRGDTRQEQTADQRSTPRNSLIRLDRSAYAGVAKLADARDLKSRDLKRSCGFDPRPRHQIPQEICKLVKSGLNR